MTVGTYVATPVGSCYWAKFDSTGATTANENTQATRVVVEIKAGDYSFFSQACGGWTRDTTAEDAASKYPNSPEADLTPCSAYLLVGAADQAEVAGRFLITLRERDKVDIPSVALVKKFAAEVRDTCKAGMSTKDYNVGLTTSAVYQSDKKAWRK